VSYPRGGKVVLYIKKIKTKLGCENYFKLSESVRCCGMERTVERTKVMRISRQPSSVQIEIYQKQQKDVKYFSYFCNMKTKLCNILYTRKIQFRTATTKKAFNKNKTFSQAHWSEI
jgi:hypothetical protein